MDAERSGVTGFGMLGRTERPFAACGARDRAESRTGRHICIV